MKLIEALQSYSEESDSDPDDQHRRVATELTTALADSPDAQLEVDQLDDAAIDRLLSSAPADDRAAARDVLESLRSEANSADGVAEHVSDSKTKADDPAGTGTDTAADSDTATDSDASTRGTTDPSNIVHREKRDAQLPSWPVLAGLAVAGVAIIVGLVWFLNRSDEPTSDTDRAAPTADEYLSPKAGGAALVTDAGDMYVVEEEPVRWVRVWRGSNEQHSPAVQVAASGKNVGYLLEDGTVRMYRLGTFPDTGKWVWQRGEDKNQPEATHVAVTKKYLLFSTADGAVHVQDLSDSERTISTLREPTAEAPLILAAGGGFAYLYEGGQLLQIDLADPTKETVIEGASADGPLSVVRARAKKIATLSQDGIVRIFEADQPTGAGTLVWDGSGYSSKVVDVSLATGSISLLFEDGTVRSKNQEAKDPALLGRLIWKETDSHAGASAIGSKGDLVLFAVADGKARAFDIKAKKDEATSEVFFKPTNDVYPTAFAPQEP